MNPNFEFDAVFQNHLECVQLLAADGSILKINPAGLQMLEASSLQQVENRSVYALLVEEHHAGFRELMEKVFRGEAGSLEFQVAGLQGNRRWLAIHASPLRDATGAITALLGISRDITVRKQAEGKLRESEERLRLALDVARMGEWDWNIRTGEVVWSQRCMALYGLPPDSPMTYARFLQALHPEDRARIDAALRRAVKDRASYDEQKRIVWPDGSIRWTASRGQVYCDAAGQPVRMAGVSFDITEHKRAEAAVCESAERQRLAAQASNVGLWDWDLRTDQVVFSPEWKSQLGFGEHEIGADYSEWERRLHPDDLAPTLAALRAYREGRQPEYAVEFRLRHKDGSYRWIYARGEVFRDAGGKSARMLGCHVDITERKRAQEELTLFRTLIDYANDSIEVIDPETGRFLDVNEKACQTLGYTREEYLSLTVPEINPLIAAGPRMEIVEDLRRSGSRVIESQHRRKDGSVFPVEINVAYIRLNRDYILAVVRDITERKRAEAALQASVARMTRQESALIALSRKGALPGGESLAALRQITEVSARTLDVERVSVWRYTQDRRGMHCVDLYELSKDKHSAGLEVTVADFPNYFQTLAECDVIAADDANEDPKTCEFSAKYLTPLGITSMLDAPTQLKGVLDGVVCHEHVGPKRHWTADERTFAIAIGNAASLALEESKRRQAEQALRRSHLAYTALINTVDGIVWEVDAATFRFLFVSHQAERILGYPTESWLADPNFWRNHIHPQDRDWAMNYCVQAIGRRQDHDFQYRMIAADGRVVWLHDLVTLVVEAGSVVKLRGIMVDITERKRAEQALRDSEERFRELAETIQEVFWITDPAKNRMLYISPAYEAIWGRSCQSLYDAPRSWLDAIHPDDRERVLRAATTRQIEGTYDEEYRIIQPGGQVRWIRDLAYPVRNATGQVERVVGVARDITERMTAEADLNRREEHFRLLIENASDLITVINHQGVIRYQSPAARRVLGYSPEEMIGRSAFEFIHPDDAASTAAAIQRAATSIETPISAEYRFRHQNGQWRILQSVGRSTPGQAQEGFIVVNSRDVTENRQLEEQFRQSQKMDAIGQLAGGVAHDFNNILAAIMMQSEMAGMGEDVPGQVQDGLRDIRVYAERAANLTQQLLLFSRRQVMQPRNLDLNESVTSLAKMLQRIIGEDVQLQLHLHPAPLMTRADAGMLDQVLMNLAVNARDAMPEGGRLVIETAEKTVDDELARLRPDAAPGRYVCLGVRDTGGGIPPEILPRIFEPFFTTKEPGKGTGLGLATVYGIVKQHQGWLKVDSEPGRGAIFQVFLPAVEITAEALAGMEAEPEPRGGSETILLAEDDLDVRMLTRMVLELHGYKVLETANGVEALRAWQEHRRSVALLLTDLVMPGGMSGQQVARRLQEDEPQLKVIFTSGYSAEIAGRDIPLRTSGNFLQKPFTPHQLLDTVRRSLDG